MSVRKQWKLHFSISPPVRIFFFFKASFSVPPVDGRPKKIPIYTCGQGLSTANKHACIGWIVNEPWNTEVFYCFRFGSRAGPKLRSPTSLLASVVQSTLRETEAHNHRPNLNMGLLIINRKGESTGILEESVTKWKEERKRCQQLC